VGAALFVQELDKVSLLTTTSILDRLAPLGEELDGRERLDIIFGGERAIGFGIGVNVSNNTLKDVSISEWWGFSECEIPWFPGGSPWQLQKV
jgi:hypothetical protein